MVVRVYSARACITLCEPLPRMLQERWISIANSSMGTSWKRRTVHECLHSYVQRWSTPTHATSAIVTSSLTMCYFTRAHKRCASAATMLFISHSPGPFV
eukprot:COSAG01_NODE_6072_length_3867_cov_176.980626_5_plen_99_part_00